MNSKLIGVRVPDDLLKIANRVVKEYRYESMQVLMREALREFVVDKELRRLNGIAKNKPGVRDGTKAELHAYVQAIYAKERKALAQEIRDAKAGKGKWYPLSQ